MDSSGRGAGRMFMARNISEQIARVPESESKDEVCLTNGKKIEFF